MFCLLFISGNGGCGLCTPKETGSCIAAEYLGIPSVMIAAPGFVDQARSAATAAGVPIQRVAEYPGAFASHTRDELRDNTRNILWPQILKALTTPFTEEEIKASQSVANETNGIVFTGTYDEVNHYFAEMGWTDGLPIVPPTEERVAQFLKFTDKRPDAVVAELPVAFRKTTVRHVAVNGVMSGCPAEFMPILIAFTQAMGYGEFRKTLASTHAWTPFCWLNGPLARQLGIDCAQGEISTQKNARIGRFINLAMLNLGGYYVKENRMGTFGYLMPWCLVEDEAVALKAGWKPYQMQRGYSIDDSTLTAASSINWGNNLVPATSDGERIKDMMALDACEKSQMAVASGMPCTYRAFFITEGVARDLAKTYSTKDALCRAIENTARIPLGARAFANYWGNPGSAFNPETYPLSWHERRIRRTEEAEWTATPPWFEWSGANEMETVPAMAPGKSAFVVTGDPSRNKVLTVPGGGFATIKIELPKAWNSLMAERGYKPLADFRLKTDLKPDTPPPETRSRPYPMARGGGWGGSGAEGASRRPGAPGSGRVPRGPTSTFRPNQRFRRFPENAPQGSRPQ